MDRVELVAKTKMVDNGQGKKYCGVALQPVANYRLLQVCLVHRRVFHTTSGLLFEVVIRSSENNIISKPNYFY